MAQRVAEMRERRQAARTARRTENRRHSGSLRKNSRTPPGKQAAGKRAARRKHGRGQREPVMPPVAPVLHATAHDGEAKRSPVGTGINRNRREKPFRRGRVTRRPFIVSREMSRPDSRAACRAGKTNRERRGLTTSASSTFHPRERHSTGAVPKTEPPGNDACRVRTKVKNRPERRA